MRETTIILAPDVGVTAVELAAAWNAEPGRAAHAPARVERNVAKHYDQTDRAAGGRWPWQV